MNNDTYAAGPDRLLHHLLAGRRPDAAPLEEVAEVLAGGAPDATRTQAVVSVLHKLSAGKMLKLDDTGQKTYSPNPFSMYSFSLMPGNRQQRQLEDWRDGSSASTAAPNQIPEFVESPVYNLQHCELLKAKPLLQAEALWPELADQWCGVYAEAQAAEKIGLVAAKRLTALANGKCTSIGSIIKNKRPPYSDFYDKVLKLWDADKFIARAKVDGVWNDGPAELGKAWPGAAVHRVR